MIERVTIAVDAAHRGARLDALVSELPGLSRSQALSLIGAEKVVVNARPAKPAYRVRAGDVVEVTLDLPPAMSAAPQDIPLTVVYQDADIAVIDKPAGLVVHPAPGHAGGTLANAIAALFPAAQGVGPANRPGIVHRLDKDTSGLIAVALSSRGMASLQRQIASHEAGRRYIALVTGHLAKESGTVDAPIGRDRANRKRMAVHGLAPRAARTHFRVLERLPNTDLVEAQLETGRTHQIRVHFAALGHPLAGDGVYRGAVVPGLDRQFLHAAALSVRLPESGERVEFRSPLPGDLAAVLAVLRGNVTG